MGTGSNDDVSMTLSRNYSKNKQQIKKSTTIVSYQSSDNSSLGKKTLKVKGSANSGKAASRPSIRPESTTPSHTSGGKESPIEPRSVKNM